MMAKIGYLEVDTIKFAPNSLTGSSKQSFAVSETSGGSYATIYMPGSGPIMLFWACEASAATIQTTMKNEVMFEVRRISGTPATLFSRTLERSGSLVKETWNGSILDIAPGVNPIYNVYIVIIRNPGIATAEGTLLGVYMKK